MTPRPRTLLALLLLMASAADAQQSKPVCPPPLVDPVVTIDTFSSSGESAEGAAWIVTRSGELFIIETTYFGESGKAVERFVYKFDGFLALCAVQIEYQYSRAFGAVRDSSVVQLQFSPLRWDASPTSVAPDSAAARVLANELWARAREAIDRVNARRRARGGG